MDRQLLPQQNVFRVWTPPNTLPKEAKVQELIDLDCKHWNFTLINKIFLPFEANEIKFIPLSFRFPEDKMIWHFSKDGLYEVKSGYQLALHHIQES